MTDEGPKSHVLGQYCVPFCRGGNGVGRTSPGRSALCWAQLAGMKEDNEMFYLGESDWAYSVLVW